MKIIKNISLAILITIGLFITYQITSLIFVAKPVVKGIKQTNIIINTNMDGGVNLNLYGTNLNDIICVYINDEWVKNISINNISDEEIQFNLPNQYYYNVDESTLKIKLEKKINSDKTVFSNTSTLHITKDDSSIKPIITNTDPEILDFNNTENNILKIYGNNFKKGCKVMVNNKEYDANYIDESNIEIAFSYYDWCESEKVSITISQQSSAEDPFIYNLTSDEFVLEINGRRDNPTLNYDWVAQNRYVAHAFGTYNDVTYTNSLEAFQTNYEKGFRVFEVDMSFTSDNILMLRHDWGKDWLIGRTELEKSSLNNLPKSFDAIKSATSDYTLLSFDDLCRLMTDYPDIYIITDTKETGSVGINHIFRYLVNHAKAINESILDRLIIQIYNEQMYYQILNIYDFQSIIYTLYYNNDSEEKILDFIRKTGIKVVTMFDGKFGDNMYNFIDELNYLNVYVYVHTINDTGTMSRLLQNGVYGFYTDNLSPTYPMDMEAERNKYFNRPDFKSITNISDYIKEINQYSDMVMILSVKDDASAGLSEELQKILYDCGATQNLQNSFRSGYILISNNGHAIFEEKSSERLIKYTNILDEKNIYVASGGYENGNIAQIVIDDIEYSQNLRGMNIVVYNTINRAVYDVINYDLFGGGIFTRFDSENIKNTQQINSNLEFMMNYFDDLLSERYVVLFSVNDDSSTNVTEEIKQKLYKLGLNVDIEFQKSYIAVINGLECIYNASSSEKLIYDDFINGSHIQIQSAGIETGKPIASIVIDGREYSKNTRGLNIVVYDKLSNKVIDSITFDMYDKYTSNYDE